MSGNWHPSDPYWDSITGVDEYESDRPAVITRMVFLIIVLGFIGTVLYTCINAKNSDNGKVESKPRAIRPGSMASSDNGNRYSCSFGVELA